MRLAVFIFLLLTTSCREIIYVDEVEKISGYQINGFVTNTGGTPLENVEINLYYEKIKISNIPIDTVQAAVKDSNSIVSFVVVDVNGRAVKNLFTGKLPVGPIPRVTWDGYISPDIKAQPGYYVIQISIDNIIIKESPVIIDGSLVAKTDRQGSFVILNEKLPVGKIFDRYDSPNKYLGTYSVATSVILELFYGSIKKTGRVNLKKDIVTKVNITI
ncbi:MAG: hypothetical protein QME25_04040 [Bacteroidota bacterium]|nr:hypothetical protein [Bacteroidota bacterium]MDI6779349.1 hypothetical protein [Bacteroidota bacterium]